LEPGKRNWDVWDSVVAGRRSPVVVVIQLTLPLLSESESELNNRSVVVLKLSEAHGGRTRSIPRKTGSIKFDTAGGRERLRSSRARAAEHTPDQWSHLLLLSISCQQLLEPGSPGPVHPKKGTMMSLVTGTSAASILV